MIKQAAIVFKQGLKTETHLWRGVIAKTIQDWLAAPIRAKREAERYLFDDSADLSLVCNSAGINISHLRMRLNKVRGQTLDSLLAVAD